MDEQVTKPKSKAGRPTIYSKELVEEICKRLGNGQTLRSICREEGFPNQDTVHNWLNKYPEFVEQYTHARIQQADTYAEMIVDEAFSSHDAAIGRLRMDALKWAASKMAPKKYGDKIEVEANQTNNIKLSFTVPHRDAPIDVLELEDNKLLPE
jgi:hypothetical protein